jgi:LysM repeat protein
MKTYPTRHPNWIDESDGTQPPKKAWTERIGISFPVAFVIVLGLHLAVLGGIYASTKMKPHPSPQPLAAKEKESPKGPVSDAFVARNDWPQAGATPEVKAIPQVPKKALPTAKVAAKQNGKPMSLFAPPTEKKIEAPKPAQAVAHVPSPAAAPKATPVAKASDSALRSQFLATQKASHQAQEVTETHQSIPATPNIQPAVAKNAKEVSTIAPKAKAEACTSTMPTKAIATASTPVAHRAIAATSIPTAQKARASIPAPAAPSKPTVQTSTPAPAVTEYVLNGGDNLYSVSRRLQVSYSDLMQANGISDPRQLRVGQKLKVPERKSDI